MNRLRSACASPPPPSQCHQDLDPALHRFWSPCAFRAPAPIAPSNKPPREKKNVNPKPSTIAEIPNQLTQLMPDFSPDSPAQAGPREREVAVYSPAERGEVRVRGAEGLTVNPRDWEVLCTNLGPASSRGVLREKKRKKKKKKTKIAELMPH